MRSKNIFCVHFSTSSKIFPLKFIILEILISRLSPGFAFSRPLTSLESTDSETLASCAIRHCGLPLNQIAVLNSREIIFHSSLFLCFKTKKGPNGHLTIRASNYPKNQGIKESDTAIASTDYYHGHRLENCQ